MKAILPIILFLIFANSCELIVIGTPPQKVKPITIDRSTSFGSVILFANEIDTNNIQAAAEILDNSLPPRLRAIDRYDKYYELYGTHNYIDDREITSIESDTLEPGKIKVTIELNYTKKIIAKTFLRDSFWYISDYEMK